MKDSDDDLRAMLNEPIFVANEGGLVHKNIPVISP